MTEEEFWVIVEKTRRKSKGDYMLHCRCVVQYFKGHPGWRGKKPSPAEDVQNFYRHVYSASQACETAFERITGKNDFFADLDLSAERARAARDAKSENPVALEEDEMKAMFPRLTKDFGESPLEALW